AAAGMGGTLPYMAPGQLEAYRGRPADVDGRSDLFSLGVVLFELLTRKSPFSYRRGRPEGETVQALLDARRQTPYLRPLNPAVTPAVEAIVRRCLAFDPAGRYQSAGELKEDLERHLANLPLRHAPEPSVRERLRKWRRRHPLLASTASLGTAAAVGVGLLLTAFVVRGERLARLQAADGLRRTGEEMAMAQVLLLDRSAGREQRDEGVRLCRSALDRYGVLGGADWRQGPAVRPLDAEERERLAQRVGHVLFLLAKTTQDRAF